MKNEILLFENQDVKLEVNMKDETVWLTQEQMGKLFGKDRTVITRHINNIFKDGELDEKSNVQKMHFAKSDKPVSLYNLDVIRKVNASVSNLIMYFDDIEVVNSQIQDDVIDFGEYMYNIYDVYKSLNIEEAREVVKRLNKHITTETIIKPLEEK